MNHQKLTNVTLKNSDTLKKLKKSMYMILRSSLLKVIFFWANVIYKLIVPKLVIVLGLMNLMSSQTMHVSFHLLLP